MRVAIKEQIDKDLDSVTVVRWYKNIGDSVKKGENILHVETLKADVDLAAEVDGILVEILASDGGDILRPSEKPTGSWDAVFGWIEAKKQIELAELPAYPGPIHDPRLSKEYLKKREVRISEKSEIPEKPEKEISKIEIKLSEAKDDFVKAAPYVRKRAKELGVDISVISGTGPDGLVMVEDLEHSPEKNLQTKVETAAFPERTDESFKIINFGIVAQAIARNMQESWDCIPHAGTSVRINFWNIIKARNKLKPILQKNLGEKASLYLHFEIIVIEGILKALSQRFDKPFHVLNSCFGCRHFGFDGLKIFEHINLGIAYDHPAGLLVPVLREMEEANYRQIAERLDDMYRRLEKSRVKPAEFKGGTFTFNNVGAIGADDGESIIVHGQSCICSFHRVDLEEDSSFYGYANLNLRFDHRAHTKGALAIGFLKEVKRFVEEVDLEEHVLSLL